MIPFQVFIMIWNLPQKLIKFRFIITSNMICENLCRWIINYYIVKRVEHGITFRRNWQKKLCQQLFWIIWSNYFSYHHIDFFFCESVFWRYLLLMSTARANNSLFKSETAPFSQKSWAKEGSKMNTCKKELKETKCFWVFLPNIHQNIKKYVHLQKSMIIIILNATIHRNIGTILNLWIKLKSSIMIFPMGEIQDKLGLVDITHSMRSVSIYNSSKRRIICNCVCFYIYV